MRIMRRVMTLIVTMYDNFFYEIWVSRNLFQSSMSGGEYVVHTRLGKLISKFEFF